MTIKPPTKSIANGNYLASDDTSTAPYPKQSTKTTTTMTPSSLAQPYDELQVLDDVDDKDDRRKAERNDELEDKKEKVSNRCSDNPRPDGLAPSASLDVSSLVAIPTGLSRNPPDRPASATMTARLVPQDYRRDKGVDHGQHSSKAGDSLRGPGAYSVRPTVHLVQEESTNNDDDDEAMTSTNDEQNESALLFDDPESAFEAQVVPERDLNREVQQKMEAMTIDPIAVAKSKSKNDAPNGPPRALRKSVIMITLGVLMVLVAVGSAVGILASNDKKKPPPTFAPTVVSDMEQAGAIFTPLSGNESLWDESSPQYKALWWIVHEDPARMMMKLQDDNQSSSSMIVERYVMAVFYFATDGPNWLTSYDFLGNSSICDWNDSREFGVRCHDEGSAGQLMMSKFVRLYCLHLILLLIFGNSV
jgi:hypothetical protein